MRIFVWVILLEIKWFYKWMRFFCFWVNLVEISRARSGFVSVIRRLMKEVYININYL